MTPIGATFYPLLIWYCATQNRRPWLYGFSDNDPKVKRKPIRIFLFVLFVVHTIVELVYLRTTFSL